MIHEESHKRVDHLGDIIVEAFADIWVYVFCMRHGGIFYLFF